MAAILPRDDNHKLCGSGRSFHEYYEALNVISFGSYGVVYRVVDKRTGEIVAMKKELNGACQSTLRETKILMSLPRHPSIVEFKQVIEKNGLVCLVMEYLETDLKRFISAMQKPFTGSQIKCLMKQILEGLKFLHENGVVHRDLKPSNILMNDKSQLKICDFGLSRQLDAAGTWGWCTSGVGTRWYMAPELLMGIEMYSEAVDMWSVGCIMGELVLREVLFRGRSNDHQLACIDQMIGGEVPCHELGVKLSLASSFQGAPRLTSSGLDLLESLLAYDPVKRITAEDALNHNWFKEYYGLLVV